ncbi:MAG: pilus assembly protein PilP [Rubrivivax sp.]
MSSFGRLGCSMARGAVALSTALGLAACSPSVDELQAWTDEERRNVKLGVPPLPAPTRFYPEPYQAHRGADPFDFRKVWFAIVNASAQGSPRLLRELRRQRQPLETFPIEQITMVGALMQRSRSVGLVSVGGVLYQVQPGDYMGQNNGRVLKIAESRIELSEVVQDASGRWTERAAVLMSRRAVE